MKLSNWCKKQGIHYSTGLKWFHAGKIPGAHQLDTGTILVPDCEMNKDKKENAVVYCRVSSQGRKKDLQFQVDRCLEFARGGGIPVEKVYKEVASGMNDKRRELWKALESSPTILIVENKDRLTRFGFEYLERLLEKLGCRVLVINRDEEDETDLIKDLVSIITSFCCRLYGLRRGINRAKKMKAALNED
jgi:putative resolvase